MTTEQQRIALAEWMGWEVLMDTAARFKMGRIKGINDGDWSQLPNYPSDLNAVNEVEKKLTPEQSEVYLELLGKLFGNHIWHIAYATAPQRSEALCRTLFSERFL